ncbi:hypothetical protein B0H14DRAFT_3442218 [Mycena olivaceomarginata]|nr:hypothetical protein B0H14DRAFT_3442218 [Mycena olivaceomarginata]
MRFALPLLLGIPATLAAANLCPRLPRAPHSAAPASTTAARESSVADTATGPTAATP